MCKKVSPVISFSILFITMLLSVILFAGSSFAAGGAVGSPELEWSLNTQLVIPGSDAAERGGWAKADLIDPLIARLNAEGVTTELLPVRSGVDGLSFSLKASAKGSVADFRRIFYTVMMPEFNLLGGVTELSISSDSVQSPAMDLVIEANPSTGYGWHVASGSAFTESAGSKYRMHTLGFGVSQRQVLHLGMGTAGGNTIKLVYNRVWENESATRQVTLKLSYLPARLDLSDPTASTEPLSEIEGSIDESAFPSVSEKGLPTSFDWRTQGIVTPVRDQGACGACWAFGTVGIMESTLWKNGVANKDLSEQFLVSCNTSGWSCNGGLTAHMYHLDRLGTSQTVVGAVLETDKPYTQSNGTCTSSYNHPYKLTAWQFITPDEFTMPTVDQIKSAIYTYGPVTAGVCAGPAMQAYTSTSGIFSTDETASACNGSTNHQIIIVGWDDNGGNGYWIMRNSWGAGWGLSGYMNIAYNTSRVGEGTSWVTTPAAAGPGKLKVINGSATLTITQLYVTKSTSLTWGANRATLPIAASGNKLIGNLTADSYDVRAIFSNGKSYARMNITVNSGATTTVTARPAASGKVKVINGSATLTIKELYIALPADTSWGHNLLSAIAAGGTRTIAGVTAVTHKLKAVFSDGSTYTNASFAVTSGATTTITATPPAGGSVKVVNGSTLSITEVYISLSTDPTWGSNLITTPIAAGGNTTLPGFAPGTYDLKAVFSDSSNYTQWSFAVTTGATATITATHGAAGSVKAHDGGAKSIQQSGGESKYSRIGELKHISTGALKVR